jgi:hypothetical protein
MHKGMKIVGCILAIIGLSCVIKHIMHYKENCCLCGWHKIKVEDQKSTGATAYHKIEIQD